MWCNHHHCQQYSQRHEAALATSDKSVYVRLLAPPTTATACARPNSKWATLLCVCARTKMTTLNNRSRKLQTSSSAHGFRMCVKRRRRRATHITGIHWARAPKKRQTKLAETPAMSTIERAVVACLGVLLLLTHCESLEAAVAAAVVASTVVLWFVLQD